MSDDPCPCCNGGERQNKAYDVSSTPESRETTRLDATLPPDLQSALQQFLGSGSVETLADWAAEVRRRTGGGSISIEELCMTSEQTDHWGSVAGDRYYFRCFYDAVILAALTDRPVDIRTESPSDSVIEAHAVGGADLTVTPEDAVFTFGIETPAEPPTDDGSTLEQGYTLICPYVKAFPCPEAYSQWAKRVPAATVALPLSGATELASALVREPAE